MKPLYHKSTISAPSINKLWLKMVLMTFLFLPYSCKKADTSPPSIAVSQPLEGNAYQACDEVRITGTANDNRALGQVSATLLDPFSGQILGSEVVSIEGLEANFAFNLKLGDRYTLDGEYQLRISATDAAGNVASDFVLLNISELPRKLLKTTWAGLSATGAAQLYVLDTFNQVSSGPALGQDLATLIVDNRSQALLIAESMTGRFDSRNLEDFELIFRTDLPVGSQANAITDLSAAQNRYYMSSTIPPYVRVFDRTGFQISAWNQVLYPGYTILADPDRVWLSVEGFGGLPVKLDNYGRTSESLQSANPLNWRVTDLGLAEDLLIAGGNEAGKGRIYLLSANDLLTQESNNLAEEFLELAGEGENWFVLLTSGVWRLSLQNASIQGPIVSGSFSSLAYEQTLGNLVIGQENLVEIYSQNGALLQSFSGNFGLVSWLTFHYNK